MRIGYLTADLSVRNGWATYSLQLIRALRQRGINTTVIAAHNSPEVEFPIHALLPGLTPPERHTLLRSMRQLPRLRRILQDCDIIHCTVEPFAIVAAALAGERPLFVTAHGSYVNLPRLRRFPIGALYRRAFLRSRLICVSQYTASVARESLPGIEARVINNGVDVKSFSPTAATNVSKTAPTIVAAGGIKPRKGSLQLVEAMAVVREKLPAAQCLFVGAPAYGSDYTNRVQRRIEALGLGDNVRILGFVDEATKRGWFAAADVLALPAINDGLHFEGFGLTLYEAGAAGTAVVGADNSGVADAIDHGVTGLIVSQRDMAQELPEALLTLLLDPALSRSMGDAGRRKAGSQTWDVVAAQVLDAYAAALADA